ncbi:hypothetical protein ACJZ2D_002278 [Fusarium nematophilum]
MPLQVLLANEADAAQAVAIEESAYGPNPLASVLYPGPPSPEGDTRVTDLIDLLYKNPACRWAKVVDTDLGEDEMIAFTMWYIWDTPPKDSSFSSYRGPSCNPEACELFFGGMNRLRLELLDGKPYACTTCPIQDPTASGSVVDWKTLT